MGLKERVRALEKIHASNVKAVIGVMRSGVVTSHGRTFADKEEFLHNMATEGRRVIALVDATTPNATIEAL